MTYITDATENQIFIMLVVITPNAKRVAGTISAACRQNNTAPKNGCSESEL